ncbi:MAG: type II toxin-antitoxin system HicB family antitoxin [Bryobacterales bacterium]|nr:type II toxin-antitoxin system HicB family antitoxin [Bryobacterales bacterium]
MPAGTRADHNWAACVPDLPECVTTGPSLEETRRLIEEPASHIAGMRRREELPEPGTVAEAVEIQAA